MFLNVKRRRILNEVEKRILTGIIVSDEYIKKSFDLLDPDLFNSEYSKIILNWVSDYYKKYNSAPKQTIQTLFDINKSTLSDSLSENIEYFLSTLSDEYERGDKLNVDYLYDQTVGFLKSQKISNLAKRVLDEIEVGNIREAENEIINFKEFSRKTSGWINPLLDDNIITIFDQSSDRLFSLPGVLGELIGPFERGWLFGIMGSMKRGKTWWLLEIALQALLEGYNVVFISLEMPWRTVTKRLLKRITSYSDRNGDLIIYPVFDCLKNMYGTCKKKIRVNKIKLVDNEGNIPEYSTNLKYRVCDVCRIKNLDDYEKTVWYEHKHTKEFSLINVKKYLEGFKTSFPWKNLRMKSYPAFSASVSTIKEDINGLEYNDGFIPDVIITDYADIMIPDNRYTEYRHTLDEIWKMHKNLAEERHCLVVTATQAGAKKSLKKKTLEQDDVSEDSRKLAHVDGMMTLNQTSEEKKKGVMRIGVIGHRHKEFFEEDLVEVLQQLSAGQVYLDAVHSEREKKKES